VRPDGTHRAGDSFEEQTEQTLANLIAILHAAGAGPKDVLKVTAYLVGVEHWPTFNKLYGMAFGEARPARAVVPVPALHHGHLIELEAVALRR
jgi:enamine deaminase RidA (YjgF/YER057c/UK114 family)